MRLATSLGAEDDNSAELFRRRTRPVGGTQAVPRGRQQPPRVGSALRGASVRLAQRACSLPRRRFFVCLFAAASNRLRACIAAARWVARLRRNFRRSIAPWRRGIALGPCWARARTVRAGSALRPARLRWRLRTSRAFNSLNAGGLLGPCSCLELACLPLLWAQLHVRTERIGRRNESGGGTFSH